MDVLKLHANEQSKIESTSSGDGHILFTIASNVLAVTQNFLRRLNLVRSIDYNENGLDDFSVNIGGAVIIIAFTVVAAVSISIIGTSVYRRKRQDRLVGGLDIVKAKLQYLQENLHQDETGAVDMNNRKQKELRIFMDGAFDLLHFGHMNAFRLARSLGTHLIVGVNSDESITECKGPPLMNDDQRIAMVRSCKFVDEVVPNCPYIMNAEYIQWVIKEYRIDYVVHGDDPCFVDGKDVYKAAKAAGKFRTIPRTAGVSTTDIVGRILLLTKDHHYHENMNIETASSGIQSIHDANRDTVGSTTSRTWPSNLATKPRSIAVPNWNKSLTSIVNSQNQNYTITPDANSLNHLLSQLRFRTTDRMLELFSTDIQPPKPPMRVIYIDGAWDLFHPGHVSLLQKARERGDYLIVGVHGDAVVNKIQGMSLPLMNLNERVLSVLGCRYVNDIVIDAPYEITVDLLSSLNVAEVIHPIDSYSTHGNLDFPYFENIERYKHAKDLGVYTALPCLSSFNILSVIQRIKENQEAFQAKFERKMDAERQYNTMVAA